MSIKQLFSMIDGFSCKKSPSLIMTYRRRFQYYNYIYHNTIINILLQWRNLNLVIDNWILILISG